MMMEQIIVERLTTFPEVTNLVPPSQVHPLMLPQNAALPAIRYQRLDGPRDHHILGPSGLSRPRIQVDAFTSGVTPAGYGQAKAIGEAIRHALDGYLDLMLHAGERDLPFEADTKRYGFSQDYTGLLDEEGE